MSAIPEGLRSRIGPLPASLVDASTRGCVDRTLAAAKAELGLTGVPITVKWFCGPYPALGFIDRRDPGTVWLSCALETYTSQMTVEVTAHEVAHVADAIAGRPADEGKAIAFGERVAARIHLAE